MSDSTMSSLASELRALEKRVKDSFEPADFSHLRKIERIGRIFTILGFASAWTGINPASAFAISLGIFTRWLVMHHVNHQGYDQVPGVPERYTSPVFAQGWRRFVDWFDWILPAAWAYEHNTLHHYHTGEELDPDQVEINTDFLREMRAPKFFKLIILTIIACTWKFTYYAPNTIGCLDPKTLKRRKKDDIKPIGFSELLSFHRADVRRLWRSCYLPFGLFHFALIPALFLPLGTEAALFVLINRILAEFMTNVHSFLVIGPNHTGSDIHRFDHHFKTADDFYRMQVLGTANYITGREWVDYLQIYLNYQVEHHLFPKLPMRRYREIQPEVKAICLKYDLPYIEENVFYRLYRMARVCIGIDSMKFVSESDHVQALKRVDADSLSQAS